MPEEVRGPSGHGWTQTAERPLFGFRAVNYPAIAKIEGAAYGAA
jgi:hypothetical protein